MAGSAGGAAAVGEFVTVRPTSAIILASALLLADGASAAGAASGRDALIRPGAGIGKVRLGMTLAQVKRALGPHHLGRARRVGVGQRRLELTWCVGAAHSFTVVLRGRGSDLRATLVSTDVPSEQTAAGIDRGTAWERVRRAYPNLECRMYGIGILHGEHPLLHRGDRETVFQTGRGGGGWGTPRLISVTVRLRIERPPHYRPDYRC